MDGAQPLPEAADEGDVEVAEGVDAPPVELAEAVGCGQLRPARRGRASQIPARCHGHPWRQMDRPLGFRTSPSSRRTGHPVARRQVLERAPGRGPVLVEEAPGRGEAAGAATDVAVARLVQRVVAEHVVEVGDALGQRGDRADVAVLQLLLHTGELGTEGVAAVEQRPHGRHRDPLVVLAPVLRVEAGRAGLHEVLGRQTGQIEAPERRAVATGPAAPHVVVRVDEDPQPVPARPAARPRRSSPGRPRRTHRARRARWPPTW